MVLYRGRKPTTKRRIKAMEDIIRVIEECGVLTGVKLG